MSEEVGEEDTQHPEQTLMSVTANLMLQRDINEYSARSDFPPNSLSDPF